MNPVDHPKPISRYKRYAHRHPERIKATRAAYRKKNREKRNQQKREWAAKNREHVRQYQREWQARQPPKYWQRWPCNQPAKVRKPGRTYEQVLADNRERRRKAAENLEDSYLRGWMSRTAGYRIKPSEWPDDLVEAKRAQLQLTRLCRKSRTITN